MKPRILYPAILSWLPPRPGRIYVRLNQTLVAEVASPRFAYIDKHWSTSVLIADPIMRTSLNNTAVSVSVTALADQKIC